MQAEQAEYEAADHGADQAEQEIHQDAVSLAPHDLAGQKARQDADRDLPD